MPLAQVRDLLGHASITTTERYDNQKLENLQIAAAKLESGITFELPDPLEPDAKVRALRRSARTKLQESSSTRVWNTDRARSAKCPKIEPNELEDLNLADLAGC